MLTYNCTAYVGIHVIHVYWVDKCSELEAKTRVMSKTNILPNVIVTPTNPPKIPIKALAIIILLKGIVQFHSQIARQTDLYNAENLLSMYYTPPLTELQWVTSY